jgi:serine/threonine-protein kinase CTR1
VISHFILPLLPAVVCDFGLARVVTSDAHSIAGQKFKEIRGFSPRFAAPEVFSSSATMVMQDVEVDKKSDVYSFAIVLWEMITRQVPWDGLTRQQIEANVKSGARVRLSYRL